MPMPTSASTAARVQKPPAGMAASVIAMISADRMKSVRIALATFCVLERLRVGGRGRERRLVGMRLRAGTSASKTFSAPS